MASSRLEALSLVADHFNPNAERLVDAIAGIFPRATRRARHHAYQFMLAATLDAFSGGGRLESMTGGSLRSDDYERIARNLVAFVSTGARLLRRDREACEKASLRGSLVVARERTLAHDSLDLVHDLGLVRVGRVDANAA